MTGFHPVVICAKSRLFSVHFSSRRLSLSTINIDRIGSLSGMSKLKILSLGRNLLKKVRWHVMFLKALFVCFVFVFCHTMNNPLFIAVDRETWRCIKHTGGTVGVLQSNFITGWYCSVHQPHYSVYLQQSDQSMEWIGQTGELTWSVFYF